MISRHLSTPHPRVVSAPGSRSGSAVAVWVLRLGLLPVVALLLAACGKPENAGTNAATVPAATPALPDSELEAHILQTLTSPEPEDPVVADAATGDEVTELMRRHPGKNAKELLETPEVKERLGEVLKELSQRKDLQERINSSVALAASLKGLDTKPGSHAFRLDVTDYSESRTRNMLTAVMSGSASQVVNFLVGEVGEATPELTLGGLPKSSNGVSIDPVAPPRNP